MNYLDDKDYEDVSFIKKHPEIKGVFITIAVLVISFRALEYINLRIHQRKRLILLMLRLRKRVS